MEIKRVIGRIEEVQQIARGAGIRVSRRLRKVYGAGRWRKMKGIARIELHTHRGTALV